MDEEQKSFDRFVKSLAEIIYNIISQEGEE